jgi:small subunit ribosomal protein S6e
MKINIANPKSGQQKVIVVEDEHKLMNFYDKRMGMQVAGECLGDEFKNYTLKISGGNDKQGFPMKQGVLKNSRVRLLFSKGMSCYRERRKGMRKRKSVRGCIVGHDLAILNLIIQEEGDAPVEGLTDGSSVRRLGPKRASKLRKMYDLSKTDDVRKFVVRRTIEKNVAGEGEEPKMKVKASKAPKIQRLVTKVSLQRKRFRKSTMVKKIQSNREAKKEHTERCNEYHRLIKERRHNEVAKKKKKSVKKA